jgi:deazaflavin-dependent oxidoreductase (nitroreductase family)
MSELEERHARNQQIIDEFRANAGHVGGPFEDIPLLILHSTGAKSGEERLHPVAYRGDGDNYIVFASYGGRPENPDWFYNLKANPKARIEVGTETHEVVARVAQGTERDRIWDLQTKEFPGFAQYQDKTDREIPVVILEPAA